MEKRNIEELKSAIEADISAYEGILKRDLPARPSCIYEIREQIEMLKSDLATLEKYEGILGLRSREDSNGKAD